MDPTLGAVQPMFPRDPRISRFIAKLKASGVLPAVSMVALLSSCSELMARNHARSGNKHFSAGDYAAAVKEYDTAQSLYPKLPVVALNKGLACRQMMAPGGRSEEQKAAIDCAVAAFSKLKELAPQDARGDQLYIQTLFDGDRFETLIGIYQAQLAKNEKDLGAINALIQIYTRADNWQKTLEFAMRRADVDPADAEAQYAVGVMIHNRLYQKGGADKGTYDPRPDPNADPKKKNVEPKVPPPFSLGDILGANRVELAELGIKFLDRAIAIRPTYREAMAFEGLLLRQKAYAFLEQPTEWEACITAAETWRGKATEQAPL
jgi:tetratricopeptide (TPR) repeat protein